MASSRTDLTEDRVFSVQNRVLGKQMDKIKRFHVGSTIDKGVLTGDSIIRYSKRLCNLGEFCLCCGISLNEKPYKINFDETGQLCNDCWSRLSGTEVDLFDKEEIVNAVIKTDGSIREN